MRTFLAIELPDPVKQRVIVRQGTLAGLLDAQGLAAAFRWTAAGNLHLTLRFLGDTSAAQRAQIEAAATAIAAAAPRFQLAVGQAGAFPNLRKPNILWLDFTGDLAQLIPLQARIEAAARAAGFPPETRAFTPHLTIARAQKSATPAQLHRAGEILRAALGSVQPNPSAAAQPEPSATAQPEPSATAQPEPSATAQPEPSAAAQPEPSATAQPEPSADLFTVEAVHLIHSDLRPGGPIYTPIATFSLR